LKAKTADGRRERNRVAEGGWTGERLLDELRRRAAAGQSLTAHDNGALRFAAGELFGSWRAALQTAGVHRRAAGAPKHKARDALDVLFTCRMCGEDYADLATHVVHVHHLSPSKYELAYEPLPNLPEIHRGVLRALRAYVASGAKPTAAELRRREPRLHRALRLIAIFESVDAALDFVLA
jgi:hypothetical protein